MLFDTNEEVRQTQGPQQKGAGIEMSLQQFLFTFKTSPNRNNDNDDDDDDAIKLIERTIGT